MGLIKILSGSFGVVDITQPMGFVEGWFIDYFFAV